jgi:basic membrane protein A
MVTISTRRVVLSSLSAVSVIAFFVGCAPAPEIRASAGPTSQVFLPCMVSDAGGFNDKSFNQLGFEGLVAAANSLGGTYKSVESASDTDFAPNITSLVDEGCEIIVTVGYLLESATTAAAAANPDVDFTIIDSSIEGKNIKPIIFNSAQAAFLAGYAAASFSKTGAVGTFGGMQIPTVTIFMDGFADGVAYYNQAKSTAVKIIGWDMATQTGSFTGGFQANETAKNTAQGIIDQNADVILPVGGPIFLSAIEAIKDSGKDVAMIGVDADLVVTHPENASLFLTSIVKEIELAVSDVVKGAAVGDFNNMPYIGTLGNHGVSIAPFHDYASKINPLLPGELDVITAGIINGSIVVTSPSAPQ